MEIDTASRHVQVDVSRQSDDTSKYKRRGEMSPMLHNSPIKRKRRIRAASQGDNGQLNELMRRLQQVELARQKEQAEMAIVRRKLEQYEWTTQPRSRDQPSAPPRSPAPHRGQPPKTLLCQPGQSFVPQENTRQPEVTSLATVTAIVCWNCGQPGHLAPQCLTGRREVRFPPFPDRPVQPQQMDSSRNFRPMQTGQQQQSQASQPSREYRALSVKKSSVRATSGDSFRSATYLKARVDGREQDCLLDTGSKVSLLPATLVPRSQFRPTDYTLRAANATPIEVLGCADVPITTEMYSLVVDGIVTNHVTEVMLGVDWLSDNSTQWNFVDSTIQLGGSVHKLSVRPRGVKWCRRVVVQESCHHSTLDAQRC